MSTKKNEKDHTILVSDSFNKTDENCNYEVSFRRWLVREIAEQRMTRTEAIERFNFHPNNGHAMLNYWHNQYAPELLLDLPVMTEKEKQKLEALQKQVKAMEKQLEEAKMKNIALNVLIDVAEEKLSISIRKKPGAKQ